VGANFTRIRDTDRRLAPKTCEEGMKKKKKKKKNGGYIESSCLPSS